MSTDTILKEIFPFRYFDNDAYKYVHEKLHNDDDYKIKFSSVIDSFFYDEDTYKLKNKQKYMKNPYIIKGNEDPDFKFILRFRNLPLNWFIDMYRNHMQLDCQDETLGYLWLDNLKYHRRIEFLDKFMIPECKKETTQRERIDAYNMFSGLCGLMATEDETITKQQYETFVSFMYELDEYYGHKRSFLKALAMFYQHNDIFKACYDKCQKCALFKNSPCYVWNACGHKFCSWCLRNTRCCWICKDDSILKPLIEKYQLKKDT